MLEGDNPPFNEEFASEIGGVDFFDELGSDPVQLG